MSECNEEMDSVPSMHDNWISDPHIYLRNYPNGQVFLLKLRTGAIHACELTGNIPSDDSWKAQRLSDLRIFRLEKQTGAKVIVLPYHGHYFQHNQP